MSLNVDEQVRLEVTFCSDRPVRAESRILMRLEDNKHVTTTVQVMGEACQDVVSLHDIGTESQDPDPDVDEGRTEKRGWKRGQRGWVVPERWFCPGLSPSPPSRWPGDAELWWLLRRPSLPTELHDDQPQQQPGVPVRVASRSRSTLLFTPGHPSLFCMSRRSTHIEPEPEPAFAPSLRSHTSLSFERLTLPPGL